MAQPTISPRMFASSPLLAWLLDLLVRSTSALEVVAHARPWSVNSHKMTCSTKYYLLALNRLVMKVLQLGSPLDFILYSAPLVRQVYKLVTSQPSSANLSSINTIQNGNRMVCLVGSDVRVAVSLAECLRLAMLDIGIVWPPILTLPAPRSFLTLPSPRKLLALPAPALILTLPAPERILALPAPAPLLALPFPKVLLTLPAPASYNSQSRDPEPVLKNPTEISPILTLLVSSVIGFFFGAYCVCHRTLLPEASGSPSDPSILKNLNWIFSAWLRIICKTPTFRFPPGFLESLWHKVWNNVSSRVCTILDNLIVASDSTEDDAEISPTPEDTPMEDSLDKPLEFGTEDRWREVSDNKSLVTLHGVSDQVQHEELDVGLEIPQDESDEHQDSECEGMGEQMIGSVGQANLPPETTKAELAPLEQLNVGSPIDPRDITAATGSSSASSQWAPQNIAPARVHSDNARAPHAPTARASHFYEVRRRAKDAAVEKNDGSEDSGTIESGNEDAAQKHRNYSNPLYFIRMRRKQRARR